MKTRNSSLLLIGAIVTPLMLSGCANTQAPKLSELTDAIKIPKISNPFDSRGRQFKSLVDDKKYSDALRFFTDNYNDYFRKRYIDENEPPSVEIIALADYYYSSEFRARADSITDRLAKVTAVGTPAAWHSNDLTLRESKGMISKLSSDNLIITSGKINAYSSNLKYQSGRVEGLYRQNRQNELAKTFATVIASGTIPPGYPLNPFTEKDYINSRFFQEQISLAINSSKSDSERDTTIAKLKRYISSGAEQELANNINARKAKERLLADGRIDAVELTELGVLSKQYGSAGGFDSLAKIGFVDLTKTNMRDRSAYDFDIDFNKDFGLPLLDAKDVLLSSEKLTDYDFVLVVDVSSAKATREFQNKREVTSKVPSGSRQEDNPSYITAMTEYQTALTEMQRVKLENAIEGSKPCYGNAFVCGAAAFARGLLEGQADKRVREASDQLSRTPRYNTRTIYSDYNYQTADVSTSKVVRVDYYLIDVKKKQVISNNTVIKKNEKFLVPYGVREEDPNRTSILTSTRTETTVSNWEKERITINLSETFDQKTIASANRKQFTSTAAFLQPLASKKIVATGPVYERGGEPIAKLKTGDSKVQRQESGTVADDRFMSVVVVRAGSSMGTGFFVTPNLVLTAEHVVGNSKLVEMTSYDGTKISGTVIDHDVRLDLALIKTHTTGKPAKIYRGSIRLGETVEAIGHPKGYEFTITRGVVSALRNQSSVNLKSDAKVEFVQTDTPISPGNSGGPLFLKDSVIGVNDWARVDKGSQSLNFSVSYNEIRAYLDRVQSKN